MNIKLTLTGLTLMKNSILPCNTFHEIMYALSYLEQFLNYAITNTTHAISNAVQPKK